MPTPHNYSAPGVYVELLKGSGPISGVSTSIAGFVLVGITPAAAPAPGPTVLKIKGSVSPLGAEPLLLKGSLTAEDDAAYTIGSEGITLTSWSSQPNSADGTRTELWTLGAGKITPSASGAAPKDVVGGSLAVTFSDMSGATVTGVSGWVAVADGSGAAPPASPLVSKPVLVTSWADLKRAFTAPASGSAEEAVWTSVHGFFANGGSLAWVCCAASGSGQSKNVSDALAALEAIDDISMVVAPGLTDPASTAALIAHCVKLKDRVAVLDLADQPFSGALTPGTSSNVAACYYPWIQASSPVDGGAVTAPPSGFMAGIWARTDATRGVHKAPANEIVLGATGLSTALSQEQNMTLYPKGINCIRQMNGAIRVWGARTMVDGASSDEYMYINVRRLINYLSDSISKGTQWAVFEPNSPALWAKVRRNVSAFLLEVWGSGALFGVKPEQAFYVKCDEENNPQSQRDKGYLVIEVGVAPVKPAEFVVFQLSQWNGSAS